MLYARTVQKWPSVVASPEALTTMIPEGRFDPQMGAEMGEAIGQSLPMAVVSR